MRIGILGGAFNPVHNGHLDLAKAAIDSGMVSEVWFMPTGKSKYKNDELIDASHRLEMLKLATRDMEHVQISDIELEREGYCYTYDTAKILNEMDATFYFIIGLDSFYDLPNWYRGEELMDIANFIVAFRVGFFSGQTAQKVANFSQCYKGKFDYLDVTLPNISSTDIRKKLAKGKSINGLLPEAVEGYIKTWHLYKV